MGQFNVISLVIFENYRKKLIFEKWINGSLVQIIKIVVK
jgi:hypothetical protein